MTTAYDVAAWSGFALAAAICSASLLGLLLVSLSLALDRARSHPRLPGRAGMVLAVLVGTTVASLALLVPGQSATALGLELALLGLALVISVVVHMSTAPADPGQHRTSAPSRVPGLFPLVPAAGLVVGGICLETSSGGGLYWVLGAVVAGILVAVGQAWALLVDVAD